MKFEGSERAESVRLSDTAKEAKRLGGGGKLRPDWEDVKENVMMRALLAKFEQHSDFRELLLGTGDARLVEHTNRDAYWGDGGDGSGKNRLGICLMKLRDSQRKRPVSPEDASPSKRHQPQQTQPVADSDARIIVARLAAMPASDNDGAGTAEAEPYPVEQMADAEVKRKMIETLDGAAERGCQ
eukprot:TRINITY_DN29_c1_g1_i5.p1 TRINITY_DN29_c1_g1~~TRINITY_DN29_c1_g1_i5.p1  ORF type:complete len:184 (-),score=30.90 TRINITY_DN29_c1_g1_i5:39-590(-)